MMDGRVRRYTLCRDPEYQAQMLVRPDGKWVLYADHIEVVSTPTADDLLSLATDDEADAIRAVMARMG